MIRVVVTYRAQTINPNEPVDDLRIETTQEFPPVPRGEGWELDLVGLHRRQAEQIADALFDCLPGGTLDHLFAEFCRRKASMLAVKL